MRSRELILSYYLGTFVHVLLGAWSRSEDDAHTLDEVSAYFVLLIFGLCLHVQTDAEYSEVAELQTVTVAEHLLHFVEDGIERLFENALGDASVSSIILRNVSNKGEYYFESSSWSDVSGSKYYTLANSDMNITTASQALSSNYLFVIPQKRDANGITGTYLDITYTISGQEAKNTTIPLAVDWQAGKQYTINIKLGTSTII